MLERNGELYKYPAKIKKYIGGVFNYIYIPKEVNGDVLGNLILPAKIEILTKSGRAYQNLNLRCREILDNNPIKCDYSKMCLDILNEKNEEDEHVYFIEYWKCYKTNNPEKVKEYYNNSFIDEYTLYMNRILEEFAKKFTAQRDTNH